MFPYDHSDCNHESMTPGERYKHFVVDTKLVLSKEDEQKVLNLLNRKKRCPSCKELLTDGCMPGCTDRD